MSVTQEREQDMTSSAQQANEIRHEREEITIEMMLQAENWLNSFLLD